MFGSITYQASSHCRSSTLTDITYNCKPSLHRLAAASWQSAVRSKTNRPTQTLGCS